MLIIPNLVISSWSLIWLLLGDKVPVVKGDEFSFEDSLWREHAFALICLTAISNIEWLQRRKWGKVKKLINQSKTYMSEIWLLPNLQTVWQVDGR